VLIEKVMLVLRMSGNPIRELSRGGSNRMASVPVRDSALYAQVSDVREVRSAFGFADYWL
jgi:hypothetical protein